MKTIKVNVKDTNKNVTNVTDNAEGGKAYFAQWNSTNFADVDERAVVNRWFTYTEIDGVYTLTPAVRMMTTCT